MARHLRWALFLWLALCSAGVGQQYFPEHSFEKEHRLNDPIVKWYSGQLKALQEPSLWETSKSSKTEQVYRFLWLRTFNHPIAVRLEVREDCTGLLTTKMTSGAGGYDPDSLIENSTRTISKEAVDHYLARFEAANYWALPANDPDSPGLDGAEWIIEAVRGGDYKLIIRWSPRKGPVRDLGISTIHLADLKIPREEIY